MYHALSAAIPACLHPAPGTASDSLLCLADELPAKDDAEASTAVPAEAAPESLADSSDSLAAAAAGTSGARNGMVLAGAVFGALLVGGLVVAVIVRVRRRRALAYAKLRTESTQSYEF